MHTSNAARIAAAFLAFLPLVVGPTPQGDTPVTVQVKTWVQREWTDPAVTLFRRRGDFYSLDSLLPDHNGLLQRAPDWSTQEATHAQIENIQAGFWDDENNRYVFIGQDIGTPATKIVATYYSSTWTLASVYDLVGATNALGGKHLHNCVYWGGDLYVIGANKKVYRGSSYTTALAEFYATTDAYLLAPAGDRMYLVTEAGKVLRLNSSDNAFETHYTPIGTMDIQFMTAFRGYLLIAARGDDGTLHLYRLPDAATDAPATLAQLAHIPGTGDIPEYGLPFAVFDDELYFFPGRTQRYDNDRDVPIFKFNGSRIEPVATLTNDPDNPETIGLTVWNDHLVWYELDDSTTQTFKVLVGNRFVDLPSLTTTASTGYKPWVGTMGAGELVVSGWDADSEGLYHLGGTFAAAESPLADGNVVTSWLDLDLPGRQKRLEQISVVLDGKAADFKVLVKYRTDDATSWTTATTGNNTTVVRATTIGADFYKIQVRVDLDDDTGSQQDIRIAGISVTYTRPGEG